MRRNIEGKGYALKTWKIAKEALNPDVNLVLESVPSAVSLYANEGFKQTWSSHFYSIPTMTIIDEYSGCTVILQSNKNLVVSPHTINFSKIKSIHRRCKLVLNLLTQNFSRAGSHWFHTYVLLQWMIVSTL